MPNNQDMVCIPCEVAATVVEVVGMVLDRMKTETIPSFEQTEAGSAWRAVAEAATHLQDVLKSALAGLPLPPDTPTYDVGEALSLLDRWERAMDNPEGPPLEIHHADIKMLRAALTARTSPSSSD